MITKKPTRNGEVRYEVRLRGPDGKERSRTFRTKKDAERHERNHHAAIDSGTWIDPRAGRVTLEAWATEWQRTVVHLRPKTRRSYESNLRATTSSRSSATTNWPSSRRLSCGHGCRISP